MKIDKYYESSASLISGILLLILGLVLIVLNEVFYKDVVTIFVFILLLIGVRNFVNYFLKSSKCREKDNSFLNCLFNLVFALVLSFMPNLSLSILPITIGAYFLINFILQIIDFCIIVMHRDKGSLYKLLLSTVYLVVGCILIFTPLKNIRTFLMLSGIYFILLGFNFIYDFIMIILPNKYKNRMKRRFRFTLPTILEMIIPYSVLNQINKFLSVDEEDFIYQKKKNSSNVDLEVFVHVSPNGFNRVGHVDIWFDNEVISYGNYDRSSIKARELFGDGVIFTADRAKYIPFVIEHSKKTLFVFGLTLSDEQKKNIKNEIDKIKADLVRWYTKAELDKKGDYADYASMLYKNTKAKFYKFKTGAFKTYFVLGNNCCLLADKIIGKSGIDLFKMNGLITPGTYYEYLNKELSKKNSIVISKNIYNEKRKKD